LKNYSFFKQLLLSLRGKPVLAVKVSAEMPGPCLPTRLSVENPAGQIADGKHKLSVLNAVRCKLLARVVSVVNNIQEYMQKTAGKSLV
jgi:hypothetical protein